MKDKTENSNEKEHPLGRYEHWFFKPDDGDKPNRPSIVVQAIRFNKKALEVEVQSAYVAKPTIFWRAVNHVSP